MFKMSDINLNVKMQISDLYTCMSLDIDVNAKMQISDLYMFLDINANDKMQISDLYMSKGINVNDGRQLFRGRTIDEWDSWRLAKYSPGRSEANAILRVQSVMFSAQRNLQS